MDAVNLSLVQSGATATPGIATDAALPDDAAAAAIDFSALLALGMNPCAQDTAQPHAQEESKTDTAIVADAQESLALDARPAAELLVATAQQAVNADALPKNPLTADAEAHATQAAKGAAIALAAQTESAKRTGAADVADQPANIAADGAQKAQPVHLQEQAQSVDQRQQVTADPRSERDALIDVLRTRASDASRPEPLSHALSIHPAETRAPLSQPSALLEVQAPVSEPGFAQALSRQVVWMVDKDAQVAELRIHPPELGPVEVRLTLTQDSAAAEFVSPHAEVRAAIENAIVRLRESMAEAGIQLGEASVSAESFSGRADAQTESRHSRDGYRDAPFDGRAAALTDPASSALRRGLVDVFA